MYLIVAFICLLLLVIAYRHSRRPPGLPPGPKTLPFIGNLNLVYKTMYFHNTLEKLDTKHAGLFSLQMGFQPVVVISDPQIMQEALVEKAEYFSGRPMQLLLVKLLFRGNGLVFQSGETWEKLRKLVVSSMRNFGVGKPRLEEQIEEEVHYLMQQIDLTNGKPFHFKHIFHQTTCNVISSVLFGKRFDYNEVEFKQFLKDLGQLLESGDFQNFAIYLSVVPMVIATLLHPSILKLPMRYWNTRQFVKRRVAEHRDTFDANHIRDFVDLYLEAEQQAHGDPAYTDEMIFQSIMDLFFAGTESTSTTLNWMFLFLIRNPDIQEKCRQEILQAVGHNRAPTMKDKSKMPFLEATILETLRIASAAPIGGLHNTCKTTTLGGYTIPKDTVVITNFYAIHMNEKWWPEPREFKPDRFVEENGDLKRNIENLVPFGLNKRKCIGDNMAKTLLFLVSSALLQRFRFKSVPGSSLPGINNSRFGVNLIPPFYEIIAEKIV